MSSFNKYLRTKFLPISFLVLSVSLVIFVQCSSNKPTVIKENNYDSLKLAHYIEKDFPYITTSMDARYLGKAFPSKNVSARIIAIKLGNDSYAAFDTDLLRWTVAWNGEYLPMFLMPQISYKEYFNKNNKNPIIGGTAQLATGIYPGWSTKEPIFKDIREGAYQSEDFIWGPVPASFARFSGVYVHNEKAILNYTVGKTQIQELPGSLPIGNNTIFTRSLRVTDQKDPLFLTVAEINNGSDQKAEDGITYIIQGSQKDSVTAVASSQPEIMTTNAYENRYLSVSIPTSSVTKEATVYIWKGKLSELATFKATIKNKTTEFPKFENGGINKWKESVFTQGKLAPDTAAFVTDIITLPLPNPYQRNVRAADIAFWPNGKAAMVTFEGDIWIAENIDKNLKNIKWTRFASGIHEPLSIEIRDNDIYVFGKEGIVRPIDLNNDGMADYYENFSNVVPQSPESREWAADLRLGCDGSFYMAKGGALSNGPGYSNSIAKGFRVGSSANGTVLKVAPDGLSYEILATGLRGPYIGLHPKTNVLTATDQQGNFVPSTPIYLIKKGDYYGVPATAHRTDNPPIAPPLTWIPHLVDRSAISEAWVTSSKMGPLNNNLVHFSFGRPGLLRVLFDSTSQGMQGGVTVIPGSYPAPTSKGRMNPKDEQLYITGFNLWGSSSNGISALLRMRYTGKPSYLVNNFEVGKEGVIIQFDHEISKESAENPENFTIKRWNYLRSEEYGSGHYKLDGEPGQEKLPVLSSYLGADRKSVILIIPDIKEVMQMEVAYKLSTPSGIALKDALWFTVNYLEPLNLKKYKFPKIDFAILADKEAIAHATKSRGIEISAKRGSELFVQMGCAGCHSVAGQTDGMYGPPLKGVFMKKRVFLDGTSAVANEEYLKESILYPTHKHVQGYSGEMPSYIGVLSDDDFESVILYIKSLK